MAKVDARRVAGILSDPGKVRAVLLHGDDAGLMRERAEALVRTVLDGAVDDPFRLAELTRDEAAKPGVLAGEAAAQALTGGRRVVRVRDATDAHAGPLKDALATPGEALLILEGGEMTARSRLRAMAEAAPEAAVIACYRERGDELAATIGRLLKEQGVTVAPAALGWLTSRLGEDRLLLRREIEKLTLYVGPGGQVDEEAAVACIAEGAALELDEALMAATVGDSAAADRALDAVFAEGTSPVQVLRSALRHVQRLHEASLAGLDAASLRPAVFFRHRGAFDRALRLWPTGALEAVAMALLDSEKRIKTTAFSRVDAALGRAAVAMIARQAQALARR